MDTRPRYEECAPPPEFAPWVACCWQIRGRGAGGFGAHRVLPDGCADLVVDLQAWHAAGVACEFVGPMTAAAVVPLGDVVDVLGVRFRPGAVGTLLRGSVRELAGLAVVPADAGLHLDLPFDRLAVAESLAQRAGLVLAALVPALRAAAPADPAVAHALQRWQGAVRACDAPAWPRVAVLARDLGLSERTLERRFAARVGYAPAEFRRLARFRRVLHLHARGTRDWAVLAHDCGYADQSHLVRDFRAFAGVAPAAWTRERARVGFLQDGEVGVD